MYKQRHLCLSINFTVHKIKSGTFTAGTVKSNFNGKADFVVARDNVFSFMISIKEHQHTGYSFYMMDKLWLSNYRDTQIFSDIDMC